MVEVAEAPGAAEQAAPAPTVKESIPVDSSPMLTREQILATPWMPKVERVETPEWGGHVFVKEMSGAQRDRFELSTVKGKGPKTEANLENLRARLVAWTVCDDNGKRLFTEDDIKALGSKGSAVLTRLFTKAQELSALTEEAVAELTESLGEDQTDSTGSD